jgi:hypothetical protein
VWDVLLLSEGAGLVGFRDWLRVVAEHQGQGVGTAIADAEEQLFFRTWRVEEIRLEASEDGLVVWPKQGFLPQDPGIVSDQWPSWARNAGHAITPEPTWPRYPEDFLRSLEHRTG